MLGTMHSMRKALTALLFTAAYLLICACRPAGAAPAELELPDYLKALPRYLFVGEMNGTVETPAFFMQLVRLYLKDNPRLVVGLELNPVEQEAINRFMGDGKVSAEVAEKRLLKERGWHGYNGNFDGRSSEAMLQLLHALRATALQQRNGYPKVAAFSTDTDEHAAHILQQAMARHPGAKLLSLSGNVHAMKQPLATQPGRKPMPMFFPAGKTFSLDVASVGGTAWVCRSGAACGAAALSPPSNLPPCTDNCFARLQSGGDFDAQYVLMRSSASPPAVQARKN